MYIKNSIFQTCLVVQWLWICLPMQGTWVWSLVQGDSRCPWATRAHASQEKLPLWEASTLQLEKAHVHQDPAQPKINQFINLKFYLINPSLCPQDDSLFVYIEQQVWSLFQEYPACSGMTKLIGHNYWAHTLESACSKLLKPLRPRARALQRSPCFATREATAIRSLHITTRE